MITRRFGQINVYGHFAMSYTQARGLTLTASRVIDRGTELGASKQGRRIRGVKRGALSVH